MSAAFTPGPWVVAHEDGDKYLRAPSQNGMSKYETLMCDRQYYPFINFNEADWQLIAASLELLEVLKDFAAPFDGDSIDLIKREYGLATARHINKARAAIAKATGGAA